MNTKIATAAAAKVGALAGANGESKSFTDWLLVTNGCSPPLVGSTVQPPSK